jgi:hypothetical protein
MTYANKQREITPEAGEYINEVFTRLTAICPAWKQAFSSTKELNAVKKEWITGFYDSGIKSKHVVDYALAKLRESGEAFIPPVGRFIAWCREGSLPEGIKGCLDSYKEIQGYLALPLESRKLSGLNPEVYHTLHNLGDFYGFRHADKKRSLEIWTQEHERTLETLRNGGQLAVAPPPRVAIEKTHTPIAKEAAISRLQAMRSQL